MDRGPQRLPEFVDRWRWHGFECKRRDAECNDGEPQCALRSGVAVQSVNAFHDTDHDHRPRIRAEGWGGSCLVLMVKMR